MVAKETLVQSCSQEGPRGSPRRGLAQGHTASQCESQTLASGLPTMTVLETSHNLEQGANNKPFLIIRIIIIFFNFQYHLFFLKSKYNELYPLIRFFQWEELGKTRRNKQIRLELESPQERLKDSKSRLARGKQESVRNPQGVTETYRSHLPLSPPPAYLPHSPHCKLKTVTSQLA